MKISAKVILDSISLANKRIITLELIYCRFIHGELMTHRVFSRNAASSRAIPIKKMIEDIRNEPAMPIHWGANQPGMQANTQIENIEEAKKIWLESCELACNQSEKLASLGIHKQIANRITEPFMYMRTLVTATEFDNFFTLRDHADAQPEIRELAIQMKVATQNSTPKLLLKNEWHLPFVREDEENLDLEIKKKISTARCARVSYLTHDGKNPSIDKDIILYDRLITSKPLHASPAEHQATPLIYKKDKKYQGNFLGWIQHRKIIEELN